MSRFLARGALLLISIGCKSPDKASGPEAGGLQGPATITFDAIGLGHIDATTERDAFYLQGWLTARDRLGQIELLRRRAKGRRAELMGDEVYFDDLLMRSLDIDGLAESTWLALQADEPETAAIFEAYAAGVDAYIEAIRAGDEPMSPQLAALDAELEAWTPQDSIAIEKLLITSTTLRAEPELLVGLAHMFLGDELFADIYRYAPMDDAVIVPDFAATTALPPTRTPSDGGARLAAHAGPETLAGMAELVRELRRLDLGYQLGGSNAYAVAGTHTASGHALLESDTHQGMGSPAVYMLTHLRAADTGLHIAGASFPGVPLVIFGTNGVAAWSATNSLLDHSDLYQEVLDASKTAVSFEGVWVDLEFTTHEIGVRQADGSVELRTVETANVPHHGPMLPTDALGLPLPLTISTRWTGNAPRSVAGAFRAIADATTVAEQQAALLRKQDAGLAWVLADTQGHVGAATSTLLPVREAIDPTAPPVGLLPGDGGYEWTEDSVGEPIFLDSGLLPSVIDPPRGFVVASNNDPSGATIDNDPFNDGVWYSGLFDIGSRAEQIEVRLAALGDQVTYDDMVDIQLDTTSRIAGHLLPYLLEAAERRPDLLTASTSDALAVLAAWDRRCDLDQAGPTLFHAWLGVFLRELWRDELGLVGDLLLDELVAPPAMILATAAVHWLDETAADIDGIDAGTVAFPSTDGRNFFDDADTEPIETRDELLLTSLELALQELHCATALTDPGACLWSEANTLSLADEAGTGLAEVAARPKAGGLNTVDVADATLLRDGVLPAGFAVENAPSNRFIWELDPASVRGAVILPGGQSEDPASPHFTDQLDRYLDGDLYQLPLTIDEVSAAAVDTWHLE